MHCEEAAMKHCKIVVFVPVSDGHRVRQAMGDAGAGVIAARYPIYKGLRCPPGKTPKPSVNWRRQIYSALPNFGNGVSVASLRPEEEGRIAIVTTRGPDGGGRGP
ncbi:hypothetical protein AC629_42480, partial [Bradyrhizobium sp. NAS80.1]